MDGSGNTVRKDIRKKTERILGCILSQRERDRARERERERGKWIDKEEGKETDEMHGAALIDGGCGADTVTRASAGVKRFYL